MIRLAIVAVTVFSITACLGPSRTPGRVTGTIVAGAGLLMAVGGATSNCTRSDFGEALDCSIGAAMGTFAGLVVLAVGGSGLIYNELRTPPAEEIQAVRVAVPVERRYVPNAAEIREPTTTDPMLRQLTLQASIAARAGHCGVVRSVADRVDDLDPAYRHSGFVTDHAILACIAR